jgi:ATP-dependent DNA helicase RecQ
VFFLIAISRIMDKLRKVLKQHFGYTDFKMGQEEVVSSILNCNDTLAVMPTGGGKSLCYQLPAMLLHGTVIVISPLIALMKDQVDSMNTGGIPSVFINSTLSFSDINQRIINAANGKYKLIYIAPERLESRNFLEMLKILDISFLAVDEAHCISEWGHDFRPSYLNIHKIFDHIPRCPILALTATATNDVQDDIVRTLKMTSPNRIVKGFDRKNLSYISELCDNKVKRIGDICSKTKNGSTIIYAGSRKRVESTANELKLLGIKAESYHAGMRILLRNAVQERFISGRTPVIVATNAFGMGIDKRDVRNVIHIDYPLTLEAYYQEAGRAGRDGKDSECYLLYNENDRNLPEFFIKSAYPDKQNIDNVFEELIKFSRNQNYSENDNQFIPEPVQIANSLGIDYRTSETVYGLLERAGAIGKGNISANSKIKITTSRERIAEYFENSSIERQQTIEAILRSVSPEIFDRLVSINPREIILKHFITKNDFDETIKSMQMLNLIQYYNENISSGFYLNNAFLNGNNIPVNYDELAKRCALALKKLEHVIEYANTNQCKRNYILDYFNDKNYEGQCKKCSSCNSNQKKNNLITSKYKYLKFIILSELSENFGYIEKTELQKNVLEKFCLSENLNFDKNTNNIEFINIINHELSNLNINRLIEFDNKYKSKISITQTGVEFLKHLPEHSKIMARFEKDKTKSEIIFSKLVTLRREIAEHAGVVPRGIISDVAMRKIAEVMPETEYDLKNVSGVSQLFVQKFAKLFLQELAKIKLNPKDQKVSKVAQDALKMLTQGEDFQTIKSRLFAGNMTMAANYIVEILEAGHELPRKQIVPDAVYSKVKSCVKKFPDLNARDLQPKLTIEIDQTTLKVAVAFAKAELGIL